MTGSILMDGAVKDLVSAHLGLEGSMREVVSGWHRTEGEWKVAFSSGAIVEFDNYPFPVLVMDGWEMSRNGTDWQPVGSTPELNPHPYDFDNETVEKASNGDFYLRGVTVRDDRDVDEVKFGYGYNKDADFYGLEVTLDRESFRSVVEGLAPFASHPDSEQNEHVMYIYVYDSAGNLIQSSEVDVVRPFTGFIKVKGDLELSGYAGESGYTRIPVTAGSAYTLNGASGSVSESDVLTIWGPVTGTVRYRRGDMLPRVRIVVEDEDGNPVEGAEIVLEAITNNWSLKNAYVKGIWDVYHETGTAKLYSVTGSLPICAEVRISRTLESYYDGGADISKTVQVADNKLSGLEVLALEENQGYSDICCVELFDQYGVRIAMREDVPFDNNEE